MQASTCRCDVSADLEQHDRDQNVWTRRYSKKGRAPFGDTELDFSGDQGVLNFMCKHLLEEDGVVSEAIVVHEVCSACMSMSQVRRAVAM